MSTPTQPSGVSGLDISYSLQLLYSHSRQGVTYTYTDSTSFTLPSSQLSYNTVLTAHNFTQLDGVETKIAVDLTIDQQCGQSFSGTVLEYNLVASMMLYIFVESPFVTTKIQLSTISISADKQSDQLIRNQFRLLQTKLLARYIALFYVNIFVIQG